MHFRLVDTRPKSVIMQIIRATKGHPQPECESSRPDWTGKERSFDPCEYKLFMQDHTAESFIKWQSRDCVKRLKNAQEILCGKWWKRLKQIKNTLSYRQLDIAVALVAGGVMASVPN